MWQCKRKFVRWFSTIWQDQSITIDTSLAYALESYDIVERLVPEHWTRARVLLQSSKLPHELWSEAFVYANWGRNRLPSSAINWKISFLQCDKDANIYMKSLHLFGASEYPSIYYPSTTTWKLFPWSKFLYSIEMKTVRKVRVTNFHSFKKYLFHPVSSFIDDLAHQKTRDENF